MSKLNQQSMTRPNPALPTGKQVNKKKQPKAKKYVPSLLVQQFNRLPQLTNLDIAMTADVFLDITSWSTLEAPSETAGHGILKNGVLEWACQAEIVNAGSGSVSSGTTESVIAAIQEGYDADDINLQWHTHPGFSAFHSHTDINNEIAVVNPLVKQQPNGCFYFIVASGYQWKVRKYVWFDHVLLGYHGGTVTIPDHNIVLNQGNNYNKTGNDTGNKTVPTANAKDDVDWLNEPDDYEAKVDGKWVPIKYDVNQIAPPSVKDWHDEDLCIPLFQAFYVQPFMWDELSNAVWTAMNKGEKVDQEIVDKEGRVLMVEMVKSFLERKRLEFPKIEEPAETESV